MVDVGHKAETARRAVASARICTTRAVVDAIASGRMEKGDVLAAARIAGILASKRTPEIVPLCHPVRTTHAAIELALDAARGEVVVRAEVHAVDRTGVEMEAMTAALVASLTVYDMIKGADRWASIEAAQLESKSGGKSGEVVRPAARSPRLDAPRSPEGENADGQPARTLETQARGGPEAGGVLVALRDGPLSIDEVVSHVRRPEVGAVCTFLGTVRSHNEGRAVVTLEYEAYVPMAVAEIRRLASEIEAEMPGVRLAALHRTGVLAVGEVAVACAAGAPHRDEAYRACRALIDRIKATVPIWKREHGPDGAYWIGWHDARCAGGHEGSDAG